MYLKVSCYGGCQVTLALEIGLTTAREYAVSYRALILPLSPASIPAKLRADQFTAIKHRSVHAYRFSCRVAVAGATDSKPALDVSVQTELCIPALPLIKHRKERVHHRQQKPLAGLFLNSRDRLWDIIAQPTPSLHNPSLQIRPRAAIECSDQCA